jgi:hypothetical protein
MGSHPCRSRRAQPAHTAVPRHHAPAVMATKGDTFQAKRSDDHDGAKNSGIPVTT